MMLGSLAAAAPRAKKPSVSQDVAARIKRGTGLFNAGVVGFYAIGGYTFAILTAAPLPAQLAEQQAVPGLHAERRRPGRQGRQKDL